MRAARTCSLLERALRIHEASLDPDHPTVATVLLNLAAALHTLGNAADARPLIEYALRIHEAHPAHPDVAMAIVNLATVLQALSDAAGARLP